MTNKRLIAITVLLALFLILVLQNMAQVDVQLWFWTLSLPRFWLLFGSLVIGFIVGWLLNSLRHHKKK